MRFVVHRTLLSWSALRSLLWRCETGHGEVPRGPRRPLRSERRSTAAQTGTRVPLDPRAGPPFLVRRSRLPAADVVRICRGWPDRSVAGRQLQPERQCLVLHGVGHPMARYRTDRLPLACSANQQAAEPAPGARGSSPKDGSQGRRRIGWGGRVKRPQSGRGPGVVLPQQIEGAPAPTAAGEMRSDGTLLVPAQFPIEMSLDSPFGDGVHGRVVLFERARIVACRFPGSTAPFQRYAPDRGIRLLATRFPGLAGARYRTMPPVRPKTPWRSRYFVTGQTPRRRLGRPGASRPGCDLAMSWAATPCDRSAAVRLLPRSAARMIRRCASPVGCRVPGRLAPRRPDGAKKRNATDPLGDRH